MSKGSSSAGSFSYSGVESDVNAGNVQKLLTALLRDRFCGQRFTDYDSCVQNFVFEPHSNSYVESSLIRKALAKCNPFELAYHKCLQNPKFQNDIIRSAVQLPACAQARNQLAKCQRNQKRDCEKESEELLYCGLSYMLMSRKGAPASGREA